MAASGGQEVPDGRSKVSRIIGATSIVIGVISVVLSLTVYKDSLTFLGVGILLIIMGSVSVTLS